MVLLALIIITFTLIVLVHINGRYNENYWRRRGVTFYGKNKVTGLFWDFVFRNRSMFQLLDELYKKYPNEPAVGFGSFLTPALYVKDPENVNHILQTDFHSFSDRGIGFNEYDILTNNILMLHGPKWKVIRQSMTPLFTSSKLKNMYYIMDKSAQDFVNILKNNPDKMKGGGYEILYTFCCAAISAAVFGFDVRTTVDSPLITLAKNFLQLSFWRTIKFSISILCRPLFVALRLSIFGADEKWFVGAIKQVIRERERENVKKHDFADICVHLQKNGPMKDNDTGFEVEPTDEILAAQAFFFYLAGLTPCSATFFAVIIELGRNPDMLKKVHDEIDDTFKKYNNKLTHDAVVEMEYLEKVLNEAMRMYPPIGFLSRKCVEDTVLPVGKIRVEKGTKIFLPVYESQNDPKHFDNPKVFNPERFHRNQKSSSVYMPFGKGSKNCIGERYAKLQVKAGILHILRHFTVKILEQKGGIKYKKELVQVRLTNIDFEFVHRNID